MNRVQTLWRAPGSRSIGLHMPSVFVVQANSDLRAQLTHLLDGAGFQVRGASDGEQALAALGTRGSQAPDVVLVDPEIVSRAPEFLRAVRRCLGHGAPIILVSAINDTMLPVRYQLPVVYTPNFEGLVPTVRYYARRPTPTAPLPAIEEPPASSWLTR